ncbi:Magnetosome protein MamF [Gammaproteobacteria bacterium]
MNTQSPPARRRMMAIFSYLGVLCLVPLLFNQEDDFVAFHARQGLLLWMWGVLAIFALYLPGIGPYIFSGSTFLILAGSGFGILSVLLDKCWNLPGIHTLVAKL